MTSTRDLADALRPTAALLSAHIAVESAIQSGAVGPSGLDGTTYDLLLRINLSPEGHPRPAEICRQLQLSPSHVSRRLDRAIEEGLISRRPDPSDRRAQIVTLTNAGTAAIDAFTPRLIDVVERVVFDALDPIEIDTLVALLNRVEAAAIESQQP